MGRTSLSAEQNTPQLDLSNDHGSTNHRLPKLRSHTGRDVSDKYDVTSRACFGDYRGAEFLIALVT